MLTSLAVLLCLILLIGVALSLGTHFLVPNHSQLVEKINHCLPQTQCGQCGYAGCLPYAQAIASDTAPINQCPPGGENTLTQLAQLLNRPKTPLNSEFGEYEPAQIAVIDEDACIGCALCLPACPVDAIIGAQQHVHTVLKADCTGCKLCIAPCPVDCITLKADPDKDLVAPTQQNIDTTHALPCVRCDNCSDICPVGLPAQNLYHATQHHPPGAILKRTLDCIECGLCEQVCPSHIPLLDYYRWGKDFSDYHLQLNRRSEQNLNRTRAQQQRKIEQQDLQNNFWTHQRNVLKTKISQPQATPQKPC